MKLNSFPGLAVAVLCAAWTSMFAQPIIVNPFDSFGSTSGNGIQNLRVTEQSDDGTERLLTMDYSYNGISGPRAFIFPVIDHKSQKGVSAWFGCDPVVVGQGKGTITAKVKFFNDEPGVPPQFTSDRIRVWIVNETSTARIAEIPFIKTINWGSPTARPAQFAAPVSSPKDPKEAAAALKKQEEARRLAEIKQWELEEQKRVEEEKRKAAEAKALAEAKAKAAQEADRKAALESDKMKREEAERKAAALAEAKQKADEAARLMAEAESKRIAEARRIAELKRVEAEQKKAIQEAQAREQARLAAMEKTKALEEARLKAEKEARALSEAKEKAALEARRMAEAKRLAEAEALAKEQARKKADAAILAARSAAKIEMDSNLKSKVTNIDIVNRSLDRTQMTIGVEYQYRDRSSFKEPVIGLHLAKEDDPEAYRYFKTNPAAIGRSRRNFTMFPIQFDPPAGIASAMPSFMTDKVFVYLKEAVDQKRSYLFPATMLLVWKAPGAMARLASNANLDRSKIEVELFRQNDLSNGYVTVSYHLLSDVDGFLRMKVYDSNSPGSEDWFYIDRVRVQKGAGRQIMKLSVNPEAAAQGKSFQADTIEIELIDDNNRMLDRFKKQVSMTWEKPE